MSAFQVVPLPSEIADAVRATGKSPNYGFPVHRELTAGRAPCRHCLRLIQKDREELLLFTYDPFAVDGVPPMPGPVYLHAERCARAESGSEIPEEYRGRHLTMQAYGIERKLLDEIHVSDGGEQKIAEELFAKPEVKYVHVRSTEAGCFLFKLARV